MLGKKKKDKNGADKVPEVSTKSAQQAAAGETPADTPPAQPAEDAAAHAAEPENTKPEKGAHSEHIENTGNAETGSAQKAQKPESDGNPADAQADSTNEKQLTETEVLRLYLEQSIAEIKRLTAELETARKEADKSRNDAARLQDRLNATLAEYENYRRRTAAEKENIYADAVAKAASALLPALDSLERAVKSTDSNPESFRQGVEMTLRQLKKGFESLGVSEIETDGAFNPEVHNAVMHIKDEKYGESAIVEVFEKGYRIGDRVIRHSMVKVAN